MVLKKILEEIKSNYQYIVIDCPPSLNILTVNALAVSDYVIIPTQCEYYALEGLTALLETIDKIKVSVNEGLKIGGPRSKTILVQSRAHIRSFSSLQQANKSACSLFFCNDVIKTNDV